MQAKTAKGVGDLILRGLAVVALAELSAFATLRLAVWYELRRPDPRAVLPAYGHPWAQSYFREERQAMNAVAYQPLVSWRGAPMDGRAINIDQWGYRRTTGSICRPGARTIWLFGGSGMWGWGAPDDQTIPAFVARAYAGAGRPACIVNRAQLGWRSVQELAELTLALAGEPPPDWVVFYDGFNDVFNPQLAGRGVDARIAAGAAQSLGASGGFAYLRTTNLWRLGRVFRNRWRGGAVLGSTDGGRKAVDGARAHVNNLWTAAAIAAAHGVRAAFFLQPVATVDGPRLSPDERKLVFEPLSPDAIAHVAHGYQQIRERAGSITEFHDLSPLFAGARSGLYSDICHLTPEGNRLVAERIFQVLEAKAPR